MREAAQVVPVRTVEGVDMREMRSTVEASAMLVELVYELPDAHDDTARLAQGLNGDARWATHLEYLQRLQRVGRELVAASAADRDV
jgi:hypothetical protein